MSKPNSAMGRSRDFGIPGAPGKGDKSRVTNQSDYAQNFDEINWGRKKPADVYAETEGEWPDVMDVGQTVSTPVTIDLLRE